jgi:hypothetical protein
MIYVDPLVRVIRTVEYVAIMLSLEILRFNNMKVVFLAIRSYSFIIVFPRKLKGTQCYIHVAMSLLPLRYT